jgi:tRNA-dihydrouridine synthase B
MFCIGDIPIKGDLILAPMDGYSDHPFRSLARRLGSSLSYTEFINCKDVLDGHKFLHQRIFFKDEERPIAYQLLDNEPQRFLQAAEKLAKNDPDIFDVNMGCSSRSVTHRGAGAGLLRDLEKIALIITSLANSFEQPVTAKIRLGWDEDQKDYLTLAKVIADSGAKMIAVHARTRKQMFAGEADWEAIAAIKRSVTIPVIGNGDIRSAADIQRMRSLTHCDAIMIGRAAIANPWLLAGKDKWQVSEEEIRSTLFAHFHEMQHFYGAEVGFMFYRKFAAKFIEDYSISRDARRKLLTLQKPDEFIRNLDTMVQKEHERYCARQEE